MKRPEDQARAFDVWASGSAYEAYVGRWSRLVAREFLAWLDAPAGRQWLDVGCGTGSLVQTILDTAEPARVTGVDRSEGFIATARQQIRDPRVDFRVGDAQRLPLETASVDAAVSGLVINFVPQPALAAAEMARATRRGGTAAAYVWDYAGEMQFMRHFWNAAVALDPAAAELDEGPRFLLNHPGPLRDLFSSSGLEEVEVRAIDIPTHFKDFDDYWLPFLGGQGPAPAYALSLSEERRAALREQLRRNLPYASDGSIPLLARAWAVRGVR